MEIDVKLRVALKLDKVDSIDVFACNADEERLRCVK